MGISYIFDRPVDFVKGESFMLKASQLDPTNDYAHINLGDAHSAIQSLDKASNDYETASLINPNNAVAFVKKGHVDSFIGDFGIATKSISPTYGFFLRIEPQISYFLKNGCKIVKSSSAIFSAISNFVFSL